MEKVYGSVRPLPKEKGTRRRRRSDRRNRAQAQAVVTTVPAGDEAASQYDAVLSEAAAASVGEPVSAYAEDVIIDVEILPDTGDVAVPGVFAFEAAPAAESVSAAPVSVALPAAPRVRSGFRYGCYLFVKRAFDIVASGIFLLLFSWLYLILAVCVKLSDGGPVFYRHKRLGKNGKVIYIPKFRSMKKNADKIEEMLTPEQLEQYKREYKIDNDPRITKLGNFLRKTSLDELPNIWSIFKGDISVIGPRPLMPDEVESKYGDQADKLLSVKPGMIGWWAANGRSNCTYDSGERQKLELYYVDNCSIRLDIKIIFKTIVSVFKREGAK